MFGDNDKKTPKLRLLKVVVQPVMVVDDGESLQELPVDPIVVSANEWPTYASGRFQEQVKSLQEQLEAGGKPSDATPENTSESTAPTAAPTLTQEP